MIEKCAINKVKSNAHIFDLFLDLSLETRKCEITQDIFLNQDIGANHKTKAYKLISDIYNAVLGPKYDYLVGLIQDKYGVLVISFCHEESDFERIVFTVNKKNERIKNVIGRDF